MIKVMPIVLVRLLLALVGIFLISPLAIWFSNKRKPRLKGPSPQPHEIKYLYKGSSGKWEYYGFPKIFWLWDNDEDGHLGEPYGKWSANRKGRERTLLSRWLWCFIRNPVNNMQFTSWGGVNIESLTLTYKGTRRRITDDDTESGYCIVTGKHKVTGKKYYGYERIWVLKNRAIWLRLGFKLDAEKDGLDIEEHKEIRGVTFQLIMRKR